MLNSQSCEALDNSRLWHKADMAELQCEDAARVTSAYFAIVMSIGGDVGYEIGAHDYRNRASERANLGCKQIPAAAPFKCSSSRICC